MEIILSTSSHEPYYAQISRQIQQLILSGQLHPGERKSVFERAFDEKTLCLHRICGGP